MTTKRIIARDMKWPTYLTAFLVGLFVFVFRWNDTDNPADMIKFVFFCCLGIYWAMHAHFADLFEKTNASSFGFRVVFSFGMRVCLMATGLAAALSLFPPRSASATSSFPDLLHAGDVLLSTLIIGVLIVLVGSSIISKRYSQ